MMERHGFLARVEVDGKQRWVFETDRLRDAVGASFLVASLGEVAKDHLGDGTEILATSGHAEALFDRADAARDWVDIITRHFAKEAPGMEVAGVVVPLGSGLVQARSAARQAAEQGVRARLARPDMTGRGLPWLLPCHYSGRPAEDAELYPRKEHTSGRRGGAGVVARRAVFAQTRERVADWLRKSDWPDELVRTVQEAYFWQFDASKDEQQGPTEALAEPDTWRAVVHIDGSGFGALFDEAGEHVDTPEGLKKFRELSASVEQLGFQALARALLELKGVVDPDWWDRFPVYPLLVGGDDLTLVMDGRWALFLARRYLHHFEQIAAGFGQDLRAGAGVAIVKHHFPFRLAYGLAAELCTTAKRRHKTTSSIDWHVVYDASPPDLTELRARLDVQGARLTRRPYAATADGFDRVWRAAQLLRETHDNGRLRLPRAQLNDLRAGLVRGADEGRRRLAAVRARTDSAIDDLLKDAHGTGELFVGGQTGFLDVFDHAEFLQGFSPGPQGGQP